MLDLGEILTTGDAARELQVSADLIRRLEREGRLPAFRTRSGQRLFLLADIEDLVRQRTTNKGEPRELTAAVLTDVTGETEAGA